MPAWKRQKAIFWRFWPETHFFFAINLILFTYAAFSDFNWMAVLCVWVPWGSYSQITKRSSADLKTAKNPLFFEVFRLKTHFSSIKSCLILFQHLVLPIGRWYCEFDCPWCDTVKFRGVLARTWKPQKAQFFDDFRPKRKFYRTEVPLSFLVDVIHSGGQLSCYFEPNSSNTIKLRSVSLECCGKPWKPSSRQFFGLKGNFAGKHASFIVCAPFTIKSAGIL